MEGFMAEGRQVRTLREILERLRETYCGSIGFEYMHIPDSDKCNWLRARIETAERQEYSQEEKLRILDRLTWSEMFESFLANKYTAAKRFGLEGCEVLIPGMKALIDRGAELGVESVVIGMPHRGRLNVLANVMRKPMEQVFSEFAGRKPVKEVHPDDPDTYMGSGDVKYHLGTSYDRPTISGKRIHLSLLANPSHLEAVNTVAMGKVRAKQYYSDDQSRTANMPILLHGDGAFAGARLTLLQLGGAGGSALAHLRMHAQPELPAADWCCVLCLRRAHHACDMCTCLPCMFASAGQGIVYEALLDMSQLPRCK
jgi:2-oxoglutarate dehydrogenase E1 component